MSAGIGLYLRWIQSDLERYSDGERLNHCLDVAGPQDYRRVWRGHYNSATVLSDWLKGAVERFIDQIKPFVSEVRHEAIKKQIDSIQSKYPAVRYDDRRWCRRFVKIMRDLGKIRVDTKIDGKPAAFVVFPALGDDTYYRNDDPYPCVASRHWSCYSPRLTYPHIRPKPKPTPTPPPPPPVPYITRPVTPICVDVTPNKPPFILRFIVEGLVSQWLRSH